MGTRRIDTSDAFYDSFAALVHTPETLKVVQTLVHHATRHPERAPELPGFTVRAISSRSWGAFPALRLFYWYDDEAVHLLAVEPWDELDP